ncbi:MAG TPA: SPOR domain-containing protein [Gemmatimonadaceae bacterium]|nr:SPOR domain-containing protein [Gemmatimonadaceae bacterium]
MVPLALVLIRWLLVAIVVAACGRSDRNVGSSTQAGSPSVGIGGPQALVLRVPRAGGAPRVYAYPKVDSAVWRSADPAPTPAHVLAFDDEGGRVAYEDNRGRPVLLELRLGTITVASKQKLRGLASANGSAVFGIGANGDVVRMTPAGDWSYKPPQPATTVFPQPDGAALVAVGAGANTRLIKVFPPEKKILDSVAFPVAAQTVRTQLADRLYVAVDSGLVVLRTRTLDWAPPVPFDEPITVMASTPSGDRIFVLTDSRDKIAVVDRYRDKVTGEFKLPGKAEDLRIDPFGRYLLARAAGRDSLWVIAVGTERVIGGLKSDWRDDLPFVGYDGGVVIASGSDVVVVDGETLKPRRRIRGGADDYWYPFLWDGFRPRAASLDEPVRFDSVVRDSLKIDTLTVRDSSAAVADSTAPKGYIVSFAAFLTDDRAKELAARIRVGGEAAHVVTTTRDGSTIYRVVLGPFLTKEEAEKAGKDSGHSYWVYEGTP